MSAVMVELRNLVQESDAARAARLIQDEKINFHSLLKVKGTYLQEYGNIVLSAQKEAETFFNRDLLTYIKELIANGQKYPLVIANKFSFCYGTTYKNEWPLPYRFKTEKCTAIQDSFNAAMENPTQAFMNPESLGDTFDQDSIRHLTNTRIPMTSLHRGASCYNERNSLAVDVQNGTPLGLMHMLIELKKIFDKHRIEVQTSATLYNEGLEINIQIPFSQFYSAL